MNTPEQLRLAAAILETGHPWEYQPDHATWVLSQGRCPLYCIAQKWPIRPTLATPPYPATLHNPDNLTAEQVGVGYRLALQGETTIDSMEVYRHYKQEAWKRIPQRFVGSNVDKHHGGGISIRLPLSVPWPEQPKSLTLPTPPPGMKWHREDGWKEGDLPPGTRPLYLGEKIHASIDEWKQVEVNSMTWIKRERVFTDEREGITKDIHAIHRTTRPLLFTHEGHEWVWHRPGDPMPCDGERFINYLMVVDWPSAGRIPIKASVLNWGEQQDPRHAIIGWRYADEKKTVPLGPEDVPPGSVFRSKDQPTTTFWTVAQVWEDGFYLRGDSMPWDTARERMQINRSIPLTGKWNPTAWEPCEK